MFASFVMADANGQTDGQTNDRRTGGQPENIMPPPAPTRTHAIVSKSIFFHVLGR